jgi:cytochrome c-type biogenesis protein
MPRTVKTAPNPATATGTTALATGGSGSAPGFGDRLGSRVVSSRGGWLASFGLGAIFAIGWSPCIGIILGGILTLAATSDTAVQGTLLLVAYTIGLGLPFLILAAIFDRAPRIMAPLIRHGRTVSLIGGLLVVAIGVAMVFDWLALLPRYFNFNTQI